MEKSRANAYGIVALLLLCCGVMAFVETVVEPAYPVKSAIKVMVFLCFSPLIRENHRTEVL